MPFLYSDEKTPVSTHCLKIMSNSLKIAGPQIFNMRMLILLCPSLSFWIDNITITVKIFVRKGWWLSYGAESFRGQRVIYLSRPDYFDSNSKTSLFFKTNFDWRCTSTSFFSSMQSAALISRFILEALHVFVTKVSLFPVLFMPRSAKNSWRWLRFIPTWKTYSSYSFT